MPVKNEERAENYTKETSYRHFITKSNQVHLAQTVRDARMFPTATQKGIDGGSNSRGAAKRRGMWPTPQKTMIDNLQSNPVVDERGRMHRKTGSDFGFNLNDAVKIKMWPTPLAQLCGTSPGNLQGAIDGKFHMTLNRAVKIWPTPKASASGPDFARSVRPKSGGDDLAIRVAKWPTPTVGDIWNSEKSVEYGVKKKHLNAFVKKYPTPRKREDGGMFYDKNGNPKRSTILSQVIKKYPTPTKCDSWAGNLKVGFDAPTTLSQSFQAEGQLNPDWVEWLMGWVSPGWTRLEPLDKNVFLKWIDDVSNGAYWLTDPADNGSIPRTSVEIKNRADRLSAIGNGQVPATAALAWKILNERMLTNA
jgi:hypothetical protein